MKTKILLGLLPFVLVGAAPPQAGSASLDHPTAFVRLGHRCGTPVPPEMQLTKVRMRLSAFREVNEMALQVAAVTAIPIYFHVITDDAGNGDVSDATIAEQVRVLNDSYEKHGYHFITAKTDRTPNSKWYRMVKNSAEEVQAKASLGRDQKTHLNLYVAAIGGGLLGWATFPYDLAARPKLDGVVVLNASLPGGAAGVYNQGKTAVHEVGHWLGLYHTFQGGCQPPGDEVSDTPAELEETTGNCADNKDRDTCPSPGGDNVSNYMNLADDACMIEFTPGQIQRVKLQVATYRTPLLSPSVRNLFRMLPID